MLHIIKTYKKLFLGLVENRFDTAGFVNSFDSDNNNKLNYSEIADLMNDLSTKNEELYSKKYDKINKLLDEAIEGNDVETQKMINALKSKQQREIDIVTKDYDKTRGDIISNTENVTESIMIKGFDNLNSTILRKGSRGPKVKIMQEALIKLGKLPEGSADGVFGKGTKAALKAFQGAGADGVFGPNTFAKMKAALDGSSNNYDHNSAKNAENIVAGMETSNPIMSNEEANRGVENLDTKLQKARVINNALEAYLNKANIGDALKDSGSDIASIFQADDFLTYLGEQDANFAKGTVYYNNAKKLLSNNGEFKDFEGNKITSNLVEGTIYYGVVGIPLFTINISDSQTIVNSKMGITESSYFYDALTTGNDVPYSGQKDIEASFNALSNASPEHKDIATRSWYRNIDFEERNNVSGSMFSWFEKNMPNWFGGDVKADNVKVLIAQYKELVKQSNFSIAEADNLITQINNELGAQYTEEVNENMEKAEEKAFYNYIRKHDAFSIMNPKTEDAFGRSISLSQANLNQLKDAYPDEYNKFISTYTPGVPKAKLNIENAKNILDRTNRNWSAISQWRTQIENSGRDLTTFHEVQNTNDKNAIKLAAIIEVFNVKEAGIDNLLKAHPAVSSSLENKLRNIDFNSASSIISASKNSEVKKYIKAVQSPETYNKYFINELSHQKAERVKGLGKKFGIPLSKFGGDTSKWAEALSKSGPTGISTLANISMQLAKATGLQVTPSELKEMVATSIPGRRVKGEIVTNFGNTGTYKTQNAEKLTTQEYVNFDVSKTYEVFTESGKKLIITETVPVNLKTDCANLNLDVSSANYSIVEENNGVQNQITIDEAMSQVRTGKFVVPLLGVSLLGSYLGRHGGPSEGAGSKPGTADPVDLPIPTTPQPTL